MSDKADEREYEDSRHESNGHITFQEWKEERARERERFAKLPKEEQFRIRCNENAARNCQRR